MVNPNYTRGLLTSEPTDWASSLEKVYARQTTQLQEHHAALRDRDRALVEKAQQESIPKVLSELAQFSTTVRSLVDTVKSKKKAKDKEKRTAYDIKYHQQGYSTDELIDFQNQYIKLVKDGTASDEAIRKIKEGLLKADPQSKLAQFLKGSTAQEQIWFKENLVKSTMSQRFSMANFHAHLRKTPGAFDKWQKNPADQESSYKAWMLQELAPMNLPDPFIKANVLPELNRKGSTLFNTQKASNLATISDQESLTFKTELSARSKDGVATSLPAYLETKHKEYIDHFKLNPEGDLTPTQSASRKIYNQLGNLLYDEHMTLSDLNDYIGFNINHPAGKTVGGVYYSKEQINDLVALGRAGLGKREARRQISLESQYQNIIATRNSGGYESQAVYESALNQLKNLGYTNTDALTKAENFQIGVLDQTVQENQKTIWENKVRGGLHKVTQDDIDSITNPVVQAEVQKVFDRLEKARVNYGNKDDSIIGIIHESRSKLPYVKGSNDHTIATAISNEIDRDAAAYELALVNAQYAPDGTFTYNPDIGTQVDIFKTNLFKSKGGGNVGGNGLYSVDKMDGEFTNYTNNISEKTTAQYNHNEKLTTANAQNWMNIANKWKENPREATPFTLQDIQGMILNADASDKMEFMADYLDVPITTLIDNSITAIQADKNVDEQSQTIGLEELKNQNREIQKAQETIIKNLDSAYKLIENQNSFQALAVKDAQILLRKGWHRLTPNQKNRIYELLLKNEEVTAAESLRLQKVVTAKQKQEAINREREEVFSGDSGIQDIEQGRRGAYQN